MTPAPPRRPLSGLALSISVSESDGATGRGFPPREVNRSVREIARAVLAQGGRVAFGHDWREDGVMDAVLAMAIAYETTAEARADEGAPMANLVPWPRRTSLSAEDRARYRGVLEIVEMPEAETGSGPGGMPMPAPVRAALHLTLMRRALTGRTHARLCIGGRVSGSSGLCAGVVEEAALSLEAGQPLYVSRLFGGAAAQVIDALEGAPIEDLGAFRPGADIAGAMAGLALEGWADHLSGSLFRAGGVAGLAKLNRLSEEENRALFAARSLAEVIGYTLTGLGRIARDRPDGAPAPLSAM